MQSEIDFTKSIVLSTFGSEIFKNFCQMNGISQHQPNNTNLT